MTVDGWARNRKEPIACVHIRLANTTCHHPHQDFLQINTQNILFICGGAFEGLENHIEKRMTRDHVRLGFRADRGFRGTKRADELLTHVTHDDLLEFGLIPEFVGRLPMVVGLTSLDDLPPLTSDAAQLAALVDVADGA